MTTRFAFIGFRHGHILDMYRRCRDRSDVQIVAACEEDAATREQLAQAGEVQITHASRSQLLAEDGFDVVAVGDTYGRRAAIIEAALQAGKHVISDKPLCISLDDLDRIEHMARTANRLVGCMLDMRDLAVYLGIRDLIAAGRIGEVHAISFEGQHPLLYGRRPMWYFEPGQHGGVLNDIIVHAVDFIPWATGRKWQSVVGARCWNATVPQHPHFNQCGQALLTLDNGAGVICDVSYLTPDSFAYEFPLYWRFTVWGSGGVIEAAVNSKTIALYENGRREVEQVALPAARPGEYLASFLREIRGDTSGLHLTSAAALEAARVALLVQQAADENLRDLPIASDHMPFV